MKSIVQGAVLLSLAAFGTGCASMRDDAAPARLTIRAFIDGANSVKVRGDQIWFEHHAYELPGQWLGGNEPTVIDGEHEWTPVWDGSVSDRFVLPDKDSALPPNREFTAETLTVRARGGWGRVHVAQYPTSENDYTLVVNIDDRGPEGAHWYTIAIDWDDAAPTN